MFQIAIIGPGSICRTYMEALKDSKIVAVKALAGRDTEKGRAMAAEYGVPYYSDQDKMYEKEQPDAVLICTPTFIHEEMVRNAIAHGVHVMCEKPFVLDAKIAKELFEDARIAGVRMMVMHVVRFWPEYTKLKAMIGAGELGKIKNVYLNRLSSHPTWATWHRNPKKSGGGLYDLHIHDVDYLYHVFGAVESVYAVGKQEESGCFNNVSTVLKFANGISAVVEGFMDMTGDFGFTTNVRVNGTEAAVEMLNKTVYLEQGEAAKASQFVVYKKGEPAEKLAVESYNPYARETEYFAECVEGNQEMKMVPDEDVVNVLRILEAIQKSLETGNLVKTEW
ncbi:MAG: Gfo/Idh/MocA family oxidoreductase [Lachnospiraceae bacterium]|nr:Gfo/Idh/MocA family oxidoreductase [Lachnospiraceae bacterium]